MPHSWHSILLLLATQNQFGIKEAKTLHATTHRKRHTTPIPIDKLIAFDIQTICLIDLLSYDYLQKID